MIAKRKILFVCSGNVDRSPTAEILFKNVVGLEVKSAGSGVHPPVPLTDELINWADEIYAMQYEQKQAVMDKVPSAGQKVKVLGIPDNFTRNDPKLKKLIIEKMKPYIKR